MIKIIIDSEHKIYWEAYADFSHVTLVTFVHPLIIKVVDLQ